MFPSEPLRHIQRAKAEARPPSRPVSRALSPKLLHMPHSPSWLRRLPGVLGSGGLSGLFPELCPAQPIPQKALGPDSPPGT